jgi:hypothetical protein
LSVPESPRDLGLHYSAWRPHQRELIEQLVALDKPAALVEALPGFGKEQPLTAQVVTPQGIRLLGDIKVGDRVSNPNGSSCEVVRVHDRGVQPIFRITLQDGSSTLAGADHLWLVHQAHTKRRAKAVRYVVRTTKQLQTNPTQFRLPLTKPVQFAVRHQACYDPYGIGVILGDGSISNASIKITTADPEIVQHFGHRASHPPGNKATDYTVKDPRIRSVLKASRLLTGAKAHPFGKRSWEKFIPPRYMFGYLEERWALMQGLMDTDGTVGREGAVSYTTTSPQLADDVQWLARSLGFRAHRSQRYPTYQGGRGRLAFTIYIQGPNTDRLFRLKRKKERCRSSQIGVETSTRIVSITEEGEAECRCITVSHPNGLYLTNDFMVTHNSAVAVALALLTKGRILILTRTKQLQDQYVRDFKFVDNLKGKAEFNCILPNVNLPVHQAPCATGWQCSIRHECPFFVQERKARGSRIIVTNYAKAFGSFLGRFSLMICDEGHLLEKQVLASFTIKLSYEEFKALGIRIPPFSSIDEAADWGMSKSAMLEREIAAIQPFLSEKPLDHPDKRARYFQLQSAVRPLRKLAHADTDAMWSIEPYRKAFYLRPLWANKHAYQLFDTAEKIVVQSATIMDGQRLAGLLGIKDYRYINVPTIFPRERRPIYFAPSAHMSLKSKPEETVKMIAAIDKVIDRYPRSKGLIHTVNMTLTEEIGKHSRHRDRMIVQTKGIKRAEAIDRFLRTPYTLLVSPSVMTGLDGRFEKARFQIIAKVPFEDQGDSAVTERLEQDADWYAYQTAFNLQQAAGRVMRDQWDYGDTWILDDNFQWFSKQHWALFSDWFREALQQRGIEQ